MTCRNWIGAAAVGLAANTAFADISIVQVGLNAGDLSADGRTKSSGQFITIHRELRHALSAAASATTFPGSYPQSASIRCVERYERVRHRR